MAEFKAEPAKRVTEHGYAVKYVARRLGVSPYGPYEWVGGVRKVRHRTNDKSLRVESAHLTA